MTNLGYILNFSTNYNANNFLYYYLPYISSGNILLFDELTKSQIPTNQKAQKDEIKNRIRNLKDHWDIYRLNPENSYKTLKISILLDYNPWTYCGFGEYSFLPFAKIHYLKKVFQQFFTKQELQHIHFYYSFLKNKEEELEELAHFLDDKEGRKDAVGIVNFGAVKWDLIQWPDWTKLKNHIENKIDVFNRIATQELSVEEKEILDQRIESIRNLFINQFKINEEDSSLVNFINQCLEDFRKNLIAVINTVEDLNNNIKKTDLLSKLFQNFSSKIHLKEGKDMVFKFTIETENNAALIASYEQLSAFLAESITFWEQTNPCNFISCGSNNNVLTIENIEFDDQKREEYFARFKSFATQNQSDRAILEEEKLSVKQFSLDASIDPKQHFAIDKDLQEKFITVDNLNQSIFPFYSEEKIGLFREALAKNSIQELENKAKINTGRTSATYNLDGDHGMSSRFTEMNIRELELQLNQLKTEEKNSQLSSQVNLTAYDSKKSEYNRNIGQLNEDFLEAMKLFPEGANTRFMLTYLTFIVLLLGLPLYTLNYWFSSVAFALFFAILITIVGVVTWLIHRYKVHEKYDTIFYANVDLFARFKEYVESLSDLAVNVRKSTLRRKNILELEKVKSTFNQAEKGYQLYHEFYNDIVEGINRNGHQFGKTTPQERPDVTIPPLFDRRNNRKYKNLPLEIISGTAQKQYDNIESGLGIIKSIKSR